MDKSLMLHRLYKILGKTHYFQTKYGIKAYNKALFESRIETKQEIVEINPAEIYLGVDGLNDRYTLIGTKIAKSPHYDLVKKISEGKDISTCNYIIREKSGSLDGRYGIKISDKDIKAHIVRYEDSWKTINEGNYSPATIYYVDGKYYVLDGKHRAAMCFLFGKRLRCRIIDLAELAHDLYHVGIYKEMQKHSNSYRKNLEHMHSFMDLRTGYPKILVVNRNRTDNLGEQDIACSIVRLFESFGADVDLAEFSNALGKKMIRAESYLKSKSSGMRDTGIADRSNRKGIKSFIKNKVHTNTHIQDLKWRLRNQNVFLPLRTNKYDYILIGGGELILSNQVYPVAFESWIKKIKLFQSKAKVGIFSVGVTDVYSKSDFKHIKKALGNIDFAYVRDEASAKNIEKLFGIHAKVIPEVVFSNCDNRNFIFLNKECNLVLYEIVSWDRIKCAILANTKEEYFEKSYNEIRNIKKHNPQVKVVLFFTTQSDYVACLDFLEYCKSNYGCVMGIEKTDTFEKLLSTLSRTKEIYLAGV